MKAICISPAAIAQTMTGTSRMRASVIRFGILKSVRPGRPSSFNAPASAIGRVIRCAQYTGHRAIAQAPIPP